MPEKMKQKEPDEDGQTCPPCAAIAFFHVRVIIVLFLPEVRQALRTLLNRIVDCLHQPGLAIILKSIFMS